MSLGHLEFRTVPEWDPQPLTSDGLTVVMDGHVFDRDGLLYELGLRSSISDAAVVLAAYRRWGEACPGHLTGEFAFVLWDSNRGVLLCVRDHVGVRPLHWARRGDLLIVASELGQILADPAVGHVPDELYVAQLLSVGYPDRERTLIDGVFRLAGGHLLTATDGATRVTRYWRPELIQETLGTSTSDWVEELRSTLATVVRCRLRSTTPVAIHLSGGMDSSTVTALAVEAIRSSAAPMSDILSVSLVGHGTDWNEARWISEVRRYLAIAGVDVEYDPLTPVRPTTPSADLRLDNGMLTDVDQAASSRGCRVILTGCGGDDWLIGNPELVLDLLWGGHPLAAARRFQEFRRLPEFGGSWRWCLSRIARPAIGRLVPLSMRRPFHWHEVPPWIDPAFARRVGLADRRARPPRGVGFARAERLLLIAHGDVALTLELMDRQTAASGAERRHPLYDRRVVELMLRSPEAEVWGEGEMRRLHRRAVTSLLPDEVIGRRDKADFGTPGATRLLAGDPEGDIALLASRGWVVEAALRRDLAQIREAAAGLRADRPSLHPLIMCRAIASWLTDQAASGSIQPK